MLRAGHLAGRFRGGKQGAVIGRADARRGHPGKAFKVTALRPGIGGIAAEQTADQPVADHRVIIQRRVLAHRLAVLLQGVYQVDRLHPVRQFGVTGALRHFDFHVADAHFRQIRRLNAFGQGGRSGQRRDAQAGQRLRIDPVQVGFTGTEETNGVANRAIPFRLPILGQPQSELQRLQQLRVEKCLCSICKIGRIRR